MIESPYMQRFKVDEFDGMRKVWLGEMQINRQRIIDRFFRNV